MSFGSERSILAAAVVLAVVSGPGSASAGRGLRTRDAAAHKPSVWKLIGRDAAARPRVVAADKHGFAYVAGQTDRRGLATTGSGDFNNDGNLDLAVANLGANTVSVLPGNGDGALIGSAAPAHAGSLPPLVVFARLYAWHGHWTPVDWKQMVNSEPLRVTVQTSTRSSPGSGISVRVALRHVSWQGFRRVVEPADVLAQLRKTMQRGQIARFQAILHVPVTHPLQFSQVMIAVKRGAAVENVVSGVTFEPPMTPAEAPLRLTVPKVFSFCAARPRLPYLSYGLAVRGYVRGIPTGGAGPGQFIVLAHPTSTSNLPTLTRLHAGFRATGFVSPPGNRLVAIAGSLVCRPEVGFVIRGVSR